MLLNKNNPNTTKREIAILGSTGSIGTQTLDIIEEYPRLFRASVLTANKNWKLLAEQALKFKPRMIVINDEEGYGKLKERFSSSGIEVAFGPGAISEGASLPCVDTVVTAMVGYSGLLPTISAIKQGKRIALANKETLVVAGELITGMLSDYGAEIVPVDSEHSAIFQCLVGESHKTVSKILLTASGGPFRTFPKEKLPEVTVAEALKHPNWNMGAKVTIDSASMMNKGFEMIEAKWLFGVSPKDIEVVVHPQSIVHSMVEFYDGSIKAQLGIPDMRLPIRYALGYPERLYTANGRLSLQQMSSLTFEKPDFDKFPMLGLAFNAIEKGGNVPCILNAANEIAVNAFINGKLRFTDISEIARKTIDGVTFIASPDLNDLIETNREAVDFAKSLI